MAALRLTWYTSSMSDKDTNDQYSEEETIARREAMLKRMLSTPPQHRMAKGEKAGPPKKRGRPSKKENGA
jgi:hypothetical protein